VRIAIAGLGIGGCAAAIALARQGHEVTVFERAAGPGPVGAGFLLQPSGQAVLARLGLLEPVAASSWPIRSFHAGRAPERGLVTLRYDRRSADAYALGVERGVLFDTLLGAVVAAGVQVVPGTRVTRTTEQRSAVQPLATDRPLGSFDLLVAADGARSTLRATIDPRGSIRMSPHAALWALGDMDEDNESRLWQESRGPGILAGILPVGPRRAAFFWGIRADRIDGLLAGPFEAFLDRVATIHPAAVPLVRSIGSLERLMVARYGSAFLGRPYRGRVVAIGDAAHATSPHLGQGANLALLDAEALADALALDAPLEARLAAFARRRTWQNRRYALLSRGLSPFFQSDHAWLGIPRDIALPLMTAVPPVRAVMERVLAGRG
jgi:2-polyprenyl-6-methoxyphenol hydroxylase-like FAD-dependent oxidoreductase